MDYLRKPLDAMTVKLFAAARDARLKDAKSQDENFIISPFAVTAVAALLYYGSKGEPSHRQLETLLRFGDLFEGSDDSKNVLMAFRAAIKTLTKCRDANDLDGEQPEDLAAQFFQMILATKIIVHRDINIQLEFAELISRNLNIDIEKLELNFSDHEGEKAIESWLKEKIESRFDISVPAGLIDARFNGPRAVIASAAHYRAGWDTPFERSRTFWGPFRLDNGRTKQVQFMNIRNTVPFTHNEHEGVKMIEIPFYQNTASLVVTISTKSRSSQQLASMPINWKQLHMQRRMRSMDITIPKFFVESTYDIKSLFNSIGIRDIFLSDTGLNQMTPEGLKISEGIHKCGIQLDEDGTFAFKNTRYRDVHHLAEAGNADSPVTPTTRRDPFAFLRASSKTSQKDTSGPPAEDFKADCPVLIAVRHNKSHLYCFVGCVANP